MEEQIEGRQKPWVSVIFIICSVLIGFVFIGQFIGVALALPFIKGSLTQFAESLRDPVGHPELKIPLYILQICVTFIGLAVCPAIYWWVYEKKNPFKLIKANRIPVVIAVVTFFMVFSFFPVNSVFIEWNETLKLPEFLKGLESWVRNWQNDQDKVVKVFLNIDNLGEFSIVFFMVSVLAGFCEEFLFRGMLQPAMYRATRNIHVSIWITAILFSALHMQFFGFVPRMLLGALFGYLYYWSGNLLIPIFAHMLNNGVSVIAIYLVHKGMIKDFDPEKIEALPWPSVVAGSVFFVVFVIYFKRFYQHQNQFSQ